VLKVPTTQGVHVDSPVLGAIEPATQVTQLEAPDPENVPTAQVRQVNAPVVTTYRPAVQLEQTDSPVKAEKVPCGQFEQGLPPPAYVPAAQAEQLLEVDPATELDVPTAQSVQSVLDVEA